jgi:ribosomal protein S6--L-glutamate ligase
VQWPPDTGWATVWHDGADARPGGRCRPEVSTVRIAIILQRHNGSRLHLITRDVVSLLRGWRCTVEALLPDEKAVDLTADAPPYDLVVLKSDTPAALSLAGVLDAQGCRIVNRYPTAAACYDKVIAMQRLRAAGLPVPQTWVTTRPARLAALLRSGPLVVKPANGVRRGVRVVRGVEDFPPEVVAEPPYLVQRFHIPDGPDRKLYVIGGSVFCVLHRRTVGGHPDLLGTPSAVTPELRGLAEAAGAEFGTDLFGLDVVISEGRPAVVDITGFPDFTGVPEVARRVADYLYATAGGHRAGRIMPPVVKGA